MAKRQQEKQMSVKNSVFDLAAFAEIANKRHREHFQKPFLTKNIERAYWSTDAQTGKAKTISPVGTGDNYAQTVSMYVSVKAY